MVHYEDQLCNIVWRSGIQYIDGELQTQSLIERPRKEQNIFMVFNYLLFGEYGSSIDLINSIIFYVYC